MISGLKGSGKDYVSDILCDTLVCERLTFAEPIKEILATTLGISKEALDEMKNNEDLKILNTNIREILQRFGTDAMQHHFGKDVWIDRLAAQLPKSGVAIVTDWRFKHEYNMLSKYGTVVSVKVMDSNLEQNSHISENDLNDFKFDFEIDNTAKNASILVGLKPLLDEIDTLSRFNA